VAFFAVVAAVDFCFGTVCDYMTANAKGGATKQLVELCEKDHYDMLVMGSSKAHHNYIPQVFSDSLGLTCYNSGYDGNGVILAYGILKMIDDDRLPKLVVFDVKQQFDIYHYSGAGDYTRYYQKLKKFIDEPAVSEIVASISKPDVLKLRSGLVRYNGDLVFTLSGFLQSDAKDGYYGYKPAVGQLAEDSEAEKDYTNQIDSLKMEYFHKLINLTKKKSIILVVVFSPEYNTPFSDDFQPIRELCEYEEISVIDYFNEPTFQKIEYFKDHCHLNEEGSRMFSEVLAKDLKAIKE
jgi:hypothetical protein